jgi:hypothetical protein
VIGATGCGVDTCVTTIHVHAVVQLCSQLEPDFENRERLILVMCTLKHRITLQTPFSDLESLQIQISLTPWGGSVPAPRNSFAQPPTLLLPAPGTSVPPDSQMCTTSWQWCSAVTCLACVLLRRASTPRARVPVDQVRPAALPRGFRTRPEGAAALQMDHGFFSSH